MAKKKRSTRKPSYSQQKKKGAFRSATYVGSQIQRWSRPANLYAPNKLPLQAAKRAVKSSLRTTGGSASRRRAERKEVRNTPPPQAKQRPNLAARSARSKTAQPLHSVATTWKDRAALNALNARRRKTRNSWSLQGCVKRPDSVHAGKVRQNPALGKGGGSKPRKWC